MAVKRILIFLATLFIPLCASADALDGLQVIYNLYAILGIVIGLIGLAILILARHKKIAIIASAIVCLLVGAPCINLINRWGLETELLGPLFCFIVGVLLVLSLLFDYDKKLKSQN